MLLDHEQKNYVHLKAQQALHTDVISAASPYWCSRQLIKQDGTPKASCYQSFTVNSIKLNAVGDMPKRYTRVYTSKAAKNNTKSMDSINPEKIQKYLGIAKHDMFGYLKGHNAGVLALRS